MFDEIVVTMDNDGDLITRAEAVKAALDWKVSPHEDVFDAIKSAIAVRMHAVPKAEGWISVEDRLPPEAGEYIVAYYPCHWDWEKGPISVGLDSFRGKTKWAKEKYQRVTHWMEKPEPPEEGT